MVAMTEQQSTPSSTDLSRLAELVRELAVVHGRVTLSSGKEADYYVDLRRATLHHEASRLIGSLLREKPRTGTTLPPVV